MKGRILLTLFALPFLGFGLWMLWSISTTVYDAWRMQDWMPAQAVVLSGGYTTNSGSDSTTWEAYGEYRYHYQGRDYVGTRVAINSGADNIGKAQRTLGSRLQQAAATGNPVTVYVNPEAPAESIVDRSVRWGLIGFKSIFVIVFGGIGLGLLIAMWRKKQKDADDEDPRYLSSPWLQNKDWQTAEIRSSSRSSMWGAWIFAGIWCLVSSPVPFIMQEEVVEKGNHIALVALFFPLAGVGLVVWAIRQSREWRRFGPTPVTLDPFPGAIGGHVGGTIDLKLPFDPSARFEVTLTALKSYVSGSGKNRSRREKADWQDTRLAQAEPGSKGTRLRFRFEVPDGLPPADASRKNSSYRLWRLNLQADIDGPDLDRSFDLPVYATGARSSLVDRSARISSTQQNAFDQERLLSRFQHTQSPSGSRLFFPMGRNLGSGLMGMLIGMVFAAIGVFIIHDKDGIIFGGIFAAVGGLIAIASFYMTFNSLEVRKDGTDLLSVRRLLGIPVKRRRMPVQSFYRLEKSSNLQTQSGGKHTMIYRISAIDQGGSSLPLGEGFRGESETRAAMRFIASTFNLPLTNTDDSDFADTAENALTAD